MAAFSAGCANREYLTSGLLARAVKVDPKLQQIRVYPSSKFIVVYNRATGDDTVVDIDAGGLATTATGERRVYPIGRKTPGAILTVDTHKGKPVLWITFRSDCSDTKCAYGFAQGNDGLFRLTFVPELKGYSEAVVYRKRDTPRKEMRKTTAYTRSRDIPIYITSRGILATIALEIPKQDKSDTTVIVVPTEGVPTRTGVPSKTDSDDGPAPPDAGPSPSTTSPTSPAGGGGSVGASTPR